jgi:hypothetical protein
VARAGPPTIELARGYLQTAFSPVANAAWQYESGYGWTLVPVDEMRAFVSAQVYALRSFSMAAGLSQDHWGFAWQPRNGSGLSAGDFAAQTGSVLDRLGAAIRDSGQIEPNDPGGGACGPPGQNVFCGGDFTGAVFTESWTAFRAWLGPVLAFATPPQTLTAGEPSTPLALNLQTSAGAPLATTTPITVTLTSSSQDGRFSLSPSGPWASQISTTIPASGTATPLFHYLDTRAEQPQLRATAIGVTTATQVETVAPGPLSRLTVDPGSAVIGPRGSRRFDVTGEDAFGNPLTASATWTVTPAGLAIVKPKTSRSTTVRAEGRGGNGLVVARAGPVSASASLRVNPGPIRVSSIRYSARRTVVRVTASVVEVGGGTARGVRTSVVVRRNGRSVFSASKRTDAAGRTTYLVPRSSGCLRTTVTSATAPGYRWNGQTPANRFCS